MGFTWAFKVYEAQGFLEAMNTPHAIDKLAEHIDVLTPWYNDDYQRAQKYIVNGAYDEFFLIGNDRFWYHLMEEGPTLHRAMAPANHAFVIGHDWLEGTVSAYLTSSVMQPNLRPIMSSQVDHSAGKITLCATTATQPSKAILYHANTNAFEPHRIDYRLMILPINGECPQSF